MCGGFYYAHSEVGVRVLGFLSPVSSIMKAVASKQAKKNPPKKVMEVAVVEGTDAAGSWQPKPHVQLGTKKQKEALSS